MPSTPRPQLAVVLGGGGLLGAHEVGMLRALAEHSVQPDLVLGTSVGALNGAFFAHDPTPAGVDRLIEMWSETQGFPGGSLLRRISTLARSGTHLQSLDEVRERLLAILPVQSLEQLATPFQCVAASIERAAEHWFDHGPLADVILASCAVPGILPPVKIGDEHYIDGGIVNSIPVGRAVALGASSVYVLQVGRIESPLPVPARPWEVGLVAFEIARRHRFHEEMSALPPGVQVHVLPTGGEQSPPGLRQFRYRGRKQVSSSIERSHSASAGYLAQVSGRR
jgi:NTE family protein